MTLTWPREQEGSTGEDVKTVQYLATAHGHPTGVDGVFGAATKAAVAAFQTSKGLGADGVVGPQTWPELIVQVQQGSDGDAVRAVQSQIHRRGEGGGLAIDGTFGTETDDAVRAFQALLGLSVDGLVGEQTWNHLINGYLAAPDPRTAADDVFAAWEADNRDQASKNATPSAVGQIFAESFSSADGWSFERSGAALGHVIFTWERPNGHELRITVIDAVEGPYFAVEQAQFT